MEDLQPMSADGQTSFCVELMKRLNIQRKQDYLCDIILVTNDDREFKAHRNVLSAVLLQASWERHEGESRRDFSVWGDLSNCYGRCSGIHLELWRWLKRTLRNWSPQETIWSYRAWKLFLVDFYKEKCLIQIASRPFISLRNTTVSS